jgi:HAD superfamily hydrolase (TIGR01450 family)
MPSSHISPAFLDQALESVRRARHLLIDWDGCLAEKGALKPGAHRLLQQFAGRVSILSNNSTDTPDGLCRFLARHGVQFPAARCFLAGDITLRLVASRVGREPVYVLGNDTMRERARALGLSLRRRGVREVVLLRDTTFTFEKLERAANLLAAGARLVVANPDATHPRGAGVTPETGALLAALSSCVDLRRVDVSIVGKPAPTLFEQALKACHCRADEVVMIGDGPRTDIAGADRLGIPSVLVGGESGVTLEGLMRGLLPARRVRTA